MVDNRLNRYLLLKEIRMILKNIVKGADYMRKGLFTILEDPITIGNPIPIKTKIYYELMLEEKIKMLLHKIAICCDYPGIINASWFIVNQIVNNLLDQHKVKKRLPTIKPDDDMSFILILPFPDTDKVIYQFFRSIPLQITRSMQRPYFWLMIVRTVTAVRTIEITFLGNLK